MTGIYKITKRDDGKSYIGQSIDCNRRIKEHCSPNRYKQGLAIDIAIHKYGVSAFEYEIIDECSIEELNKKEEYWIKYYNTKKWDIIVQTEAVNNQ
jgi:group I intron endonuclease